MSSIVFDITYTRDSLRHAAENKTELLRPNDVVVLVRRRMPLWRHLFTEKMDEQMKKKHAEPN